MPGWGRFPGHIASPEVVLLDHNGEFVRGGMLTPNNLILEKLIMKVGNGKAVTLDLTNHDVVYRTFEFLLKIRANIVLDKRYRSCS